MFYFDNSATTQPLEEVLEVYHKVAMNFFANPSSAHKLGEQSKALLQQARNQIAEIIHFNPNEVYFTSSGTEANNWVFQAIIDQMAHRHPNRKVILISAVEHPATLEQIPLIESKGFQVKLIPVNQDGRVNLTEFQSLLSDDVLLVSIMAINNEVGVVQPLNEIGQLLAAYPQAIWHVDGVQAVTTHLKCLINHRIDLLSLSSHKFHSVRGVGILAKRQRVASRPFLYGGGQEQNLRSSTENLASIVATARALRIAKLGQEEANTTLSDYRFQIIKQLRAQGWVVFAQNHGCPHIICAALPPIPGEVLLHAFEQKDVYLSTTSACSSKKHREHATLHAMGINQEISQSAIRISMSQYTTQEEVEYLCQVITRVTNQFAK